MPILLVFLGGGFGAVGRYLSGVAYGRVFGPNHPYAATFFVNVLGGLLMGVLIETLALRGGAGQDKWRLFLAVGVLGGFTTFSSFSLEAVLMLKRHAYGAAALYILGSVALSILALLIGLRLAR